MSVRRYIMEKKKKKHKKTKNSLNYPITPKLNQIILTKSKTTCFNLKLMPTIRELFRVNLKRKNYKENKEKDEREFQSRLRQ